MTDIEVTSTSESGYTTTSVTGEWELVVDATGEDGPNPNQVLAADYASCFIPAFRVGANKEGFDDIGRVEVAVEADLDDDDDLAAISFTIHVEEALGDAVDDVVARAEDICHVHAALREELRADISVVDDAF
ncbi:OsmC family protein [Salinibaculum rarum]|uniref:OsmC family protein n=1 Tax=Salinibaculum rarum TaxID=3058903 RepID=UPI00265E3BC9|nr:OsmC family protein [Salinibaculum sp. KK48]